MLHYILVFLSYILFVGIAFDPKYRRNSEFEPTVPVFVGVIHILLLTILYEKILVHILLHNVHSHEDYISFSAIGSGLYSVFFFAGLVVLGYLMGCPKPDMWTYLVFVIALVINIYLITRATSIYYDAMIKNFGDAVFDDFYTSLSKTERPFMANTFLNMKWVVMIIPGVFYQIQVLKKCDNKA